MSQLRARHDFSLEEVDRLEDRLYEHNRAATGYDDGRGLGFEALDEAGRQVGAIAGHTWGGVAEIAQLWVDPAHRGRGLSRALLQAAIAEARSRRCRHAFVMSYDFQAPGLYEKLGFVRAAELEGWPVGHTHVVLRLDLVTEGDQT
jgi:ribosomal protein S18 acetylase RimI-like enzyme